MKKVYRIKKVKNILFIIFTANVLIVPIESIQLKSASIVHNNWLSYSKIYDISLSDFSNLIKWTDHNDYPENRRRRERRKNDNNDSDSDRRKFNRRNKEIF